MPQYNPYEILGLQDGADAQAIKKAYRALAKRHHPDAGGDPEVFGRISRAYEVLTDPDKLAQWRQHGQEPTNSQEEHRRKALIDLLLLHIDAALTEGENASIKAEMKESLQQHQSELSRLQAQLTTKHATLSLRLGRIKSQGLIRDILADKLRKLEAEQANRQQEGELLREATAMVEEMQEEAAPAQAPGAPITTFDDLFRAMVDENLKGRTAHFNVKGATS